MKKRTGFTLPFVKALELMRLKHPEQFGSRRKDKAAKERLQRVYRRKKRGEGK